MSRLSRRWDRLSARSYPTNKEEAERRQAYVSILRILRCGARPTGRARLSAFHHGACCSDRTPQLSSRYALPGTRSGRTVPMVRKIVRFLTGVTRSFLSQSSGFPRRPVIVPAGRNSPEPPGNGSDEPPPAGTALAPPAGITGCRPFGERDLQLVTDIGTIVKGKVPATVTISRLSYAGLTRFDPRIHAGRSHGLLGSLPFYSAEMYSFVLALF